MDLFDIFLSNISHNHEKIQKMIKNSKNFKIKLFFFKQISIFFQNREKYVMKKLIFDGNFSKIRTQW